jgi:hypothetical protein
VITNQYDSMNRLVKKAAGTAVLETYGYDAARQRSSSCLAAYVLGIRAERAQ